MKRIIVLGVVLIVLNVLDAITTIYGLNLGFIEGNPIVDFFIENGTFWLFKIGVPIIILLIIIFSIKRNPMLYKSSTRILKVMNSVLSLIVLWNSCYIFLYHCNY